MQLEFMDLLTSSSRHLDLTYVCDVGTKYSVCKKEKSKMEKRTKMLTNSRPCMEKVYFLLFIFHCLSLDESRDGDDAVEDTQDAKDAKGPEQ